LKAPAFKETGQRRCFRQPSGGKLPWNDGETARLDSTAAGAPFFTLGPNDGVFGLARVSGRRRRTECRQQKQNGGLQANRGSRTHLLARLFAHLLDSIAQFRQTAGAQNEVPPSPGKRRLDRFSDFKSKSKNVDFIW
jgi:hypothetical protein